MGGSYHDRDHEHGQVEEEEGRDRDHGAAAEVEVVVRDRDGRRWLYREQGGPILEEGEMLGWNWFSWLVSSILSTELVKV